MKMTEKGSRRLTAAVRGMFLPVALFAIITCIDVVWNRSGFWASVADGFAPITWIVFATVSLFGLFVSFALILGRYVRWVYVLWFVWAIFYFALAYGLDKGFQRDLNGEILQIVLTTSFREAWVFIREVLSVRVAFSIFCVCCVLVLGCRLLWRIRYPVPNCTRVVCGFLLVAVFCLCNMVLLNPVKAASRVGYFYRPALAVVEYCRLWKLWRGFERTEIPPVVEVRESAEPIVGVFVIGESATRSRFGLYDRSRNTTPRLESLQSGELFVFTDLVASAAGTVSAIRLLTTSSSLDGSETVTLTLYSLLTRAGYVCPYITNNAYDRPNGMLGLLFKDCSLIKDLRGGGGDSQLLPYVKEAIADLCRTGCVVTVNGRGSHFPFGQGTARLPGAPEDDYDSTIFFTDWFLSEIVTRLRDTKRPAFLVYVSDHGESPDATIWRCLSDVGTWELPFVVWVSDEYKTAFPDLVEALRVSQGKKLQSDQLFWGLLRIMGVVSPPGYEAANDFLSPTFISRKQRRVQYGLTTYEEMKERTHDGRE